MKEHVSANFGENQHPPMILRVLKLKKVSFLFGNTKFLSGACAFLNNFPNFYIIFPCSGNNKRRATEQISKRSLLVNKKP